jgi:tRNA-2-methylthio-N6-dimethylallyladenosine synthase
VKVYIKGLNSCVMRKQKLEQYKNYLLSNGHEVVNRPENSDYNILWTCAFRHDVYANSLSEIERYGLYRGKLLVAGCMPDIVGSKENDIPWASDERLEEIFGGNLKEFFKPYSEEMVCEDATAFRVDHPDADVTFHDQFNKLVVSEGCNFHCTYCSERLAFPHHKSFSLEQIAEEFKKFSGDNHRFILLADSLGDYGSDIGSSLPELIRTLWNIDRKSTFALNNLNPTSFIKFWNDMMGLIVYGTICHLNLPIQSASNRILKLMNRGYTKEDVAKIFDWLNSEKKDFDTHVIVGFPGETEDDFNETVEFCLKYHPKYVMASAYFETPKMPSSKLRNKIPTSIVCLRLRDFANQMRMSGIICNIDYGESILNRLGKLNAA